MASLPVIILTVIIILDAGIHFTWARSCTIDINKNYNLSTPLFLDAKSMEIIYPNRASPSSLSFRPEERLMVHCFGGRLTRSNVNQAQKSEESTCLRERLFLKGKLEYPFEQLGCSQKPEPTTRKAGSCHGGLLLEIGYQVTPEQFARTIDLCHDAGRATTTWAHSRVRDVIGANRNHNFAAPSFSKGVYFGNVRMNQVYSKNSQLETFKVIFDNDKKAINRFLPLTGPEQNYFVKGHLVARADMFYYPEQYSTYQYVNVVPMWQSINNGNWKSVEATVRRAAGRLGDLDVWTGALGVLRLGGREVHLARDKDAPADSRALLPAPRLLFKLVRSTRSGEALAFLTANDPHLEANRLPREYRLCTPHEPCIHNFPHFREPREGYTYCCLAADFMRNPEVRALGIPVDFGGRQPKPLQL